MIFQRHIKQGKCHNIIKSSLVSPREVDKILKRQQLQEELDLLKYAKGKIYKIVQKNHESIIVYVGSTIQELRGRFGGHKSFFKTNPNSKLSQYVNERGGAKEFYIELIENYPCKNLTELNARERYYVLFLKPICNVALTTEVVNTESEDILTIDHTIKPNKNVCHKCGFVAACKAKLDSHLQNITPCDVGKYKCQSCRYRTNDSGNFSRHKKTCRGNKGNTDKKINVRITQDQQKALAFLTAQRASLAETDKSKKVKTLGANRENQTTDISIFVSNKPDAVNELVKPKKNRRVREIHRQETEITNPRVKEQHIGLEQLDTQDLKRADTSDLDKLLQLELTKERILDKQIKLRELELRHENM